MLQPPLVGVRKRKNGSWQLVVAGQTYEHAAKDPLPDFYRDLGTGCIEGKPAFLAAWRHIFEGKDRVFRSNHGRPLFNVDEQVKGIKRWVDMDCP